MDCFVSSFAKSPPPSRCSLLSVRGVTPTHLSDVIRIIIDDHRGDIVRYLEDGGGVLAAWGQEDPSTLSHCIAAVHSLDPDNIRTDDAPYVGNVRSEVFRGVSHDYHFLCESPTTFTGSSAQVASHGRFVPYSVLAKIEFGSALEDISDTRHVCVMCIGRGASSPYPGTQN